MSITSKSSGRLGGFSALPHDIFQSSQYAALSPRAVKLLIDIYCQFRGTNNGDLSASWRFMQKRGWKSKSQLAKALAELDVTRWVLRTRQGDINKPTLYAVTFKGVDHCGGKLDVPADPKPSHSWKYPETERAARLSGRRVKREKRPLVVSLEAWSSKEGKTHRPALHTGHTAPHEGGSCAPHEGAPYPARRGNAAIN
jgi:hypothetical protein